MALPRRRLLQGGLLTAGLGGCASLPGAAAPRVVVIGGGFAGATCARVLAGTGVATTLVEPNSTYTACPFSNLVLAGQRQLSQQQFGYAALRAAGVTVIHQHATAVDPVSHRVTLADGQVLPYQRLVMAPGIAMDWQALPGYDAAAAQWMPHAWQAGTQTLLLRRQLAAMPDGGVVAIVAPESPYRCPPGPYERASLIAHYLQRAKPRAKLLILDAKDNFSKKPLFMAAWAELYGELVQWQGVSDGARVTAVDAGRGVLQTDFDTLQVDVANVIPRQRAGLIAARSGLTDATGWCPIDPLTFASRLQPDVHVIGDAAIANAMPKSAFAANAQAKLCAVQVARALAGQPAMDSKLINTCYSLLTPTEGISVAGVYQASDAAWENIPGAGGISPLRGLPGQRKLEAQYAHSWFDTITRQVFG